MAISGLRPHRPGGVRNGQRSCGFLLALFDLRHYQSAIGSPVKWISPGLARQRCERASTQRPFHAPSSRAAAAIGRANRGASPVDAGPRSAVGPRRHGLPLDRWRVVLVTRQGFIVTHQKGSHRYYKNSRTGRIVTTIPMHSGDLNSSLLKRILKQVGLSEEEFRNLL